MRRNWKYFRPTSPVEAIRGLKDKGLERGLSVERQADLLPEITADTLYKWHTTGRIPLTYIAAYQRVCGARFITEYLAAADGALVIDIPSGRRPEVGELAALQAVVTDAVRAVIAHHAGQCNTGEALARIESGLRELGFHHGTVLKAAQPELDL